MLRLKKTKVRRLLVTLLAILIVLAMGGLVIFSDRAKQQSTPNQDVVLPEVIELELVAKDVNAHGSATRAFAARGVKAAYLHTIKVRLPEIRTSGVQYYAWLAKPDKSHIIRTGKLIQYSQDMYRLEFQDTKDYEGYDLVLVTAEQKDDNAPEVIILQGLFD